jgi:predicted CXXCH cytochrome family protein
MRLNSENKLSLSLFFLVAFSALFFAYGQSEAKVKGVCSNCHTMHNSQDGAGMVQDTTGSSGISNSDCTGCHNEPRENLLAYNCIGCHSNNASGGGGIWTLGGYDVPQVYFSGGNDMAAGNFKHITDNGYQSGHNVHGYGAGIIDPDDWVLTPPGYTAGMDPSAIKYTSWPYLAYLQQPLCAGAYGCHGNRNVESQTQAMSGAHHADDSILQLGGGFTLTGQGATIGTSYRYLSGVKGGEDSDWEFTVGSNNHNEHLGDVAANRTGENTQTSVSTMSEFCASCHGNFHMTGVGGDQGISPTDSSPWIRHPTDVLIPATAPYTDYTTFSLTGRVARQASQLPNGSTASGDPGIGTSVVYCLSCHKAHASQHNDILRYTYSDMVTGNGAGSNDLCFSCHNDK